MTLRCAQGRLLTSRERAALELASQGLTAKGIGRKLGCSEKAVGNLWENCRDKLGARKTCQAVRIARERGEIGEASQ